MDLPSFYSVRTACIHLREINQETMFKASERARHIAKRAIWSMMIIGGVAIIIGLGFSLILSNLVVRPVRQMKEATPSNMCAGESPPIPVGLRHSIS